MYKFLFVVLKDIEKKYNTKLNYPPSLEALPFGRCFNVNYIIFMFFSERNFLKNYFKRVYAKGNPFFEINYKVLEEKKSNLCICFTIYIAPLLGFMFIGIAVLIVKIHNMKHGLLI